MSEYKTVGFIGLGVMGALRAFKAARRSSRSWSPATSMSG
jgi:hypothetical protein